jgi:hypothetical protein
LLATGRHDEAKSVLTTFAAAADQGMIPNRFDDRSHTAHFNSVDASLWFIHAAFEYLEATGDLPVFSRVVFQGAGVDAGIPAVNTSNLEYPVGAAVVRTIPSALRDQISRYWLAELVVPYHAQPVAQEEVKQDICSVRDLRVQVPPVPQQRSTPPRSFDQRH